MSKLSVYILAHNEEAKIEMAIKSVKWADEIVVVDSDSTDATVSIAKGLGARVVNVPFRGFGNLRNDAIDSCSYDWIFSLDADERCTEETAIEIQNILKSDYPADAYYVPRRNWFMGRVIRHSGWYPDYRQPQLFRKGALRFSMHDEVHESYRIIGRSDYLKNPIIQIPFRNLDQLLYKANRYSTLGAEKMDRKGVSGSMFRALVHGLGAFVHSFIIKKGFLDGWAGFVIAVGNFEGTFFRYGKLAEKHFGWDKIPDKF